MITVRIEVSAPTMEEVERAMQEALGHCCRGGRWGSSTRVSPEAIQYQYLVVGDAPDFPGESMERAEKRGLRWLTLADVPTEASR